MGDRYSEAPGAARGEDQPAALSARGAGSGSTGAARSCAR